MALDVIGTLDVVVSALRAIDLRDVMAVASVAAVVYGVSQWSVPAAWVILGLLGLAVWVRPHVASRRRD